MPSVLARYWDVGSLEANNEEAYASKMSIDYRSLDQATMPISEREVSQL